MAKVTKSEMLGKIEVICKDYPEIVNFCEHEIELLARKNSSKGQTKVQKENEIILEKIVESLTTIGRPVTITEFQKEVPEMAEYSNQKLSALFSKLVNNKTIVKVVDKKKSFFSIAE